MFVQIRDWFRLITDPKAAELSLAKRWGLVITSALLVAVGGGLGLGLLRIFPVWGEPPSGEYFGAWLVGAWTAAAILEWRRLIFVPKQRRDNGPEHTHAD